MTAQRVFALAVTVLVAAIAAPLGARIAHGGGGCHEPLTDARGAGVDLKGNCLLPGVLRIDQGATVVFTNRDAVPHTVTGVGLRSGSASAWGSFAELAHEQSVGYTFASSGVYPYYCVLHPGMVGAIVVGGGNPPQAVIEASATEGFAAPSPDTASASSTARSSLSGGDGLPGRLAVFTTVIAVVATAITLIARRRSRPA